jgi:hypothetical protein
MATTKNYSVDWNDDELERGGNPPPGWYRGRVVAVDENFETGALKVTYEIITPAEFSGRKIFDTLWAPENAKDDEAAKRTLQRQLMVAKRLGVLPPEEERQGGSFTVDWGDAEGREAFLRVTQRDNYLQPEYAGVFGVDDGRVPAEVRQGHQTPLSVKPLAVKDEKAGSGKARATSQPPAKSPAGPASTNNNRPRVTTPAKPAAEDWSDV